MDELPASYSEARRLGVKKYFTGKPCKQGHVAERYADKATCVACTADSGKRLRADPVKRATTAAWQKVYQAENRERLAAQSKAWREANKERCKAVSRAGYLRNFERAAEHSRRWQQENKEQYRANQKAWHKANKEKVKAYSAARYKANAEQLREKQRRYAAANPEKVRIIARTGCAKRRARLKNVGGSYTRKDVEKLLAACAGVCIGCGGTIGQDFHVDHVIPLARGGPNVKENLQILCGPCNNSKGKKTMDEWLVWRRA